jgi:hypothetical protein
VYADERTGKRHLAVKVLTPDVFHYEPCKDNPSAYRGISLYGDDVRGGEVIKTRVTWLRDAVLYWHRKRHDTRWTLDDRKENVYRAVPGAGIHYDVGYLWSSHHGRELAESTIQANVAQSLANLNMPTQGKMLAGVFDRMAKHQKFRNAGFLDTGMAGGGNQQLLDYQTDVEGFRKAFIDAERRMAAVLLGLPPDEFENTTIPPSGESVRLRYLGQQFQAETRRPALKAACEQLVWSALQIAFVEVERKAGPGEDPLPPLAGFPTIASLPPVIADTAPEDQPFRIRIDVQNLRWPETQAEREARINFETARGYTTDAHEYALLNPDAVNAAEEVTKNKQAQALIDKASAPRTIQRPQAFPLVANRRGSTND